MCKKREVAAAAPAAAPAARFSVGSCCLFTVRVILTALTFCLAMYANKSALPPTWLEHVDEMQQNATESLSARCLAIAPHLPPSCTDCKTALGREHIENGRRGLEGLKCAVSGRATAGAACHAWHMLVDGSIIATTAAGCGAGQLVCMAIDASCRQLDDGWDKTRRSARNARARAAPSQTSPHGDEQATGLEECTD